jgi:sterol desaturase/sphingolipid hydroxylase (fatty acid hydroxylase superfamily)
MSDRSGTAARGWLMHAAQILLPCLLFAAVLQYYGTPLIYILAMLLFFVGILAWEIRAPALPPQMQNWQRWPANGLMWALNIAIGASLVPALIVIASGHGVSYGSGWLTQTFDSYTLITVISVLVLDVWHYLLHQLMHRWSWLWRMHRVHHSDRDFDLTTGLRFHPFEGAVTAVSALIPTLLLGMPFYALMTYALLVLVADYFTHANVQLPPGLERPLRKVLVTPSLHRIHHSVLAPEDRFNYGTLFSFWDRLFGTLKERSAQPRPVPLTGVEEIPAERSRGLVHSLLLPFMR